MSCKNCYKYPLCNKCEGPQGHCEDEKSKRIMLEKGKINMDLDDDELKETREFYTGNKDTNLQEAIELVRNLKLSFFMCKKDKQAIDKILNELEYYKEKEDANNDDFINRDRWE